MKDGLVIIPVVDGAHKKDVKHLTNYIDTGIPSSYNTIDPIQESSQTSKKMGLKSSTDVKEASVSNEKARLIL